MGKTYIKEWYERFKNDCTSIGNDPVSGRPSKTSDNKERVRLALEGDRPLMCAKQKFILEYQLLFRRTI